MSRSSVAGRRPGCAACSRTGLADQFGEPVTVDVHAEGPVAAPPGQLKGPASGLLSVGDGHPGFVNFVRERGHPVVRQHVFQRLPDNLCGVARPCGGYLYLRPVHSQSFSANAARAQDQEAAIWVPGSSP